MRDTQNQAITRYPVGFRKVADHGIMSIGYGFLALALSVIIAACCATCREAIAKTPEWSTVLEVSPLAVVAVFALILIVAIAGFIAGYEEIEVDREEVRKVWAFATWRVTIAALPFSEIRNARTQKTSLHTFHLLEVDLCHGSYTLTGARNDKMLGEIAVEIKRHLKKTPAAEAC